jgi:hypothetical protein
MRQPLIHLPFGHEQHAPDLGKRSSEAIADGDMEAAGVSDWITVGTVTKESGGRPGSLGTQVIKLYDAGSNGVARQNTLTTGKVYEVTGYARSDGVGLPRVANNGAAFWIGTTSTKWQKFREIFVAGNTDFRLWCFEDGQYAEFDDVSVREVILNDYDMEQSGVAAWTASNATLTKETGAAPEGGGTQVLKIAQTIAATSGLAYQPGTMTVAATYEVEGWARSDGVLVPAIRDAGIAYVWEGTTSTAWQYFKFVYTAGAAALELRSVNGAGAIDDFVEFAWVKIREVTPRTLNVGKGSDVLDAQLGDGSTSTTFPTKLPQCDGYQVDNGDYFFVLDSVNQEAHELAELNYPLTIAFAATPTSEFSGTGGAAWSPYRTVVEMRNETSTGRKVTFSIGFDQDTVSFGRGGTRYNADYSPIGLGFHSVVVVLDNSNYYIWIDGSMVGSASHGAGDESQASGSYVTNFTVGCRTTDAGAASSYLFGKLHDLQLFDYAKNVDWIRQYHYEQMAKGYK